MKTEGMPQGSRSSRSRDKKRYNIISPVIVLLLFIFIVIPHGVQSSESSDDSRLRIRRAVSEFQTFDNESAVESTPSYYGRGYAWNALGELAAGWAKDGALRSVKPSTVIDLVKEQLVSGHWSAAQVIKKALPIVIASAILILMAVVIPLVGIVFCCCRFAGKCGGNRPEEEMANLRFTHAMVLVTGLLIVCVLLCCASYLTSPSTLRVYGTLQHTETVAQGIFEDIETFKDDFIEDLENIGLTEFGSVADTVNSKLDDIGSHVASPLLLDTAPYIDRLSLAVDFLDVGLWIFSSNGNPLDVVLKNIANLISSGQVLEASLSVAKGNLTTIRDDCLGDPTKSASGACDNIPDPADIDFSAIEDNLNLDLETIRNETKIAMATIRDLLEEGNATLQNVPDLIVNASGSTIEDVRAAVSDLQRTVEDLVNDTTSTLNDMFDTLDLGSWNDTVTTTLQIPLEEQNVKIIATCLPLVLGLMVILTGAGLLLACCGLRYNTGPTHRGCPSEWGGTMLMGSACWSFTISLLVCLLAAVLLFLGSTLSIGCQTLLDLSIIREVVDDPVVWGGSSPLSNLPLGNATQNLSVYQILEDCKDDVTLYNALDLESSGLLDLVLDLDIRQMLPNFTSVYDLVNDTVSGMEILPEGQTSDLLDELTGQLSPQNISTTLSEMELAINQVSLTNVSDALNDAADAVAGAYPDMANDLRSLADSLTLIDRTDLQAVRNLTVILQEDVTRLNDSVASLRMVSQGVASSVENITSFIATEAGPILIQTLEAYIESIVVLGDQFIDEVLLRIRNDIGRCGVIRRVYDAVVGTACLFFLPGLNALWVALCVISFAIIPSIIFNVRLAKHLRSSTQPAEELHFDGMEIYANSPMADFVFSL
ncbi:prominin-1-A-like isoform X2 [Diadema setosum]|uniref:prominin-1-A-like isoform X2 n=1 Tax=Diadema setosum TaxID=31175 RepID=UPI003B3B1344